MQKDQNTRTRHPSPKRQKNRNRTTADQQNEVKKRNEKLQNKKSRPETYQKETERSRTKTQAPYTQHRNSRREKLNDSRTTTDRTVTIQTTEGSYEARLVEDDSNNFHIQKRMKLTRYRISKPPGMMRNIPKYQTSETLKKQQVLRFDIRNQDPGRQLWNRRKESSEHADQECLIETIERIHGKEGQAIEQKINKWTLRTGNQDGDCTKKTRTSLGG